MGAAAALAQTAANGTISGIITDASGAQIPNATVIIIDTDTGARHTILTNSDGGFTLPFLQSGHYEVLASSPNFAQVDHKNLQLTVGQTLVVNSALPPATVASTVEVTTDEALIDVEKTDSSQTVTQEFVNNLPVNGRRWDNFVLLTANVAPDSNSGLVSFRGINGLYNANMVDGVSNQQALFAEARGRATIAPYIYSPDSIKEFQSSVSGYSSEFGGAAGGVVNAITKSGANTLHGDLFYYLRYPTLNALDPFNKWSALHAGGSPALLTPTIRQQQQFGGSVGGAIVKNKLFYFVTYDGFRRAASAFYSTSLPASTIASYEVRSSANCPAPLTSAECTAAVNFLLSQQGTFGRNTTQDIFFPKLDWQPTSKDHVAVNYLWSDYKQPNVYQNGTTFSNSGYSTNGGYYVHERFLVGNWDRVLSNTSANSLKMQWSRDLETASANGPGPNVTITGFAAYGQATGVPRLAEPDEHRLQIFDTYSKSQGHHTWKAGVDLNFIHEVMIQLFQGDGTYTYQNNTSTGVSAFGNWVQDVFGVQGGVLSPMTGSSPGARHYVSFTQGVDPITKAGKDDFWNKNLAAFAEDQWKVASTFNLTLGLRYDTQLVPQPPLPFLKSTNGVPSPLGQLYTTKIPINYKMIQPRVGFSWNPQPRTVVRGGYGIFYGLAPLSSYYNVRNENGVYQGTYNVSVGSGSSGINSAYPLGAPGNTNVFFTPPGAPLQAPFACPGCTFTPNTPTAVGLPPCPGNCQAVSFHGMDPKFSPPYSHSVDLAVEQQLSRTTSVTLSYVTTRGMRLPFAPDLNVPPYTGSTRTYDVVSATGATQSTVTVPFYPAGLTKPSPNDGNISVIRSVLNTWYHAGSVNVKQQMKYGFSALVNYTWAHTEDAGQVSGAAGTFYSTDVILDPQNVKGHYSNPAINMTREYGNSDIDLRHRFVASAVYFAKPHFSNALVQYLTYGWNLSGTVTEQTGFPVSAMMSNTPPTGVYTTGAGTQAAAAPMDGGATGAADNTANSPASAFGRAPFVTRNGYKGPGLNNLDMRVGRTFALHERYSLELLAEAFNIANHRNNLAVATTAYSFVAPSSATVTCPASAHANTCIAPYTATTTTTTPFLAPTSTSSTLYGPRQLQFALKLQF
jgi:hypothetical protein